MAWIEQVEPGDADGLLADMYEQLEKKRGKVSNILKVHSLNPQALGDHLDLYMTIMFGKSGLSRAEREAIGVVVSAANNCAYCVNHHVEALQRYVRDDEVIDVLRTAEGLDTLEPRLSCITSHASKLTSAPSSVTDIDIDALRGVGLDDRDILDVSLITAYFNFVNRIALGLGVAFNPDEMTGYINE